MVTLLCASAWAMHPDRLYEFDFVPGKSELVVNGGFAGVHEIYDIAGRFDLIILGHPDTASFVNVETELSGPMRLDGALLDDVLNLSGLPGRLLGPNNIHFTGVEGQGFPMFAAADLFDLGIVLIGHNEAGCCDFFSFNLDAVGMSIYASFHSPGDFDGNGDVDGDDFLLWQRNFPILDGTAGSSSGDANGDGNVDGDDFLVWQRNSPYPTVLSSVPEPNSLVLFALGVTGVLAYRRRRIQLGW